MFKVWIGSDPIAARFREGNMEYITADICEYAPHEHRSDLPGVFSGFVLLSLILAVLFLI